MKVFITLLICLPLLGYCIVNVITEYKRMKVKDESLLVSVASYTVMGTITLAFMIVNLFDLTN